jgi:Undecaprenyl-phosphate galactose phosphotransferase WbaP
MQDAVDIATTQPVDALEGHIRKAGALSICRAEAWRQRLVNLTLVSSDIVLAFLVWEAAAVLQSVWGKGPLSAVILASILPNVVVWVGLRALLGLYPGYGLDQVEELRRQSYASLATLAIATIFAFTFQFGDAIARLFVGLAFLGLLLLSPIVRQFAKKLMVKHGVWGKPVIILGSGGTETSVEELLSKERTLGYRPVVAFDGRSDGRLAEVEEGAEEVPHESVLLAEAVGLGHKHRVDTIFLAMPHLQREYLAKLANLVSAYFRNVVIIPNLAGVTNSAVVARDFVGTLGLEIRHSLLSPAVQRAKRTLDLAITILGGLLILPFFLLLSGLVWLESRGAVFYSAPRIGRNGKLFSCVKFRTMVPDAETVLARMLEENPKAREEYRKFHKLYDDPRVTRIGRFLRKTSLDELPQLWNVLRGEMSLVGPRPYLPRESSEIGVSQGEILRVYPGITGPWQVSGRNGTSFAERVQIDVHYVRNWSLWLDLVILARTVNNVILGRGAR